MPYLSEFTVSFFDDKSVTRLKIKELNCMNSSLTLFCDLPQPLHENKPCDYKREFATS